MKQRLIACLVWIGLCACSQTGVAQTISISGYVQEADSGEPMAGVKVSEKQARIGGFTNSFGFFSLQLPRTEKLGLEISLLGYEPQVLSLSGKEDQQLSIFLERLSTDTVQIVSRRSAMDDTQAGVLRLSPQTISQLPVLMGETDVLKALQLMPGIQRGSEGSAALHIRGSSPDQNLLLLDDVPLYYVSHLAGLFSLFEPEALSQVEVYKGVFPARYSGRTASVIDLRMKDGNKKERKASFGMSPIAIKGHVEGPIKQDTASYFVSARLCNLLPISTAISQLTSDDFSTRYYFYDLYGKLTWQSNFNNKVQVSAYAGEDQLLLMEKRPIFQGRLAQSWGNRLASIRWNRLWSSQVFSNLTASFTQFYFQTDALTQNFQQNRLLQESRMNLRTGIQDVQLKLDGEYYPRSHILFRWGGQAIRHQFTPGRLLLTEVNVEEQEQQEQRLGESSLLTYELNLFVESEWKWWQDRIRLNAGLVYSQYLNDGSLFQAWQPRINGWVQLSENWVFKGGYGQHAQFLHLLSNSSLGLPTDVWVPVTAQVPEQTARQFSLASVWQLDQGIELSIEAYRKIHRQLAVYQEGANLLTAAADWENSLEIDGVGRAYGIEFLLQKQQGRTTGWLSYAYASSSRQFAGINAGEAFPYRFDRRHQANIVANHTVNARISLHGVWTFSSGRPFTFASGNLDLRGYHPSWWREQDFPASFYQAEYYTSRNNVRVIPYHRLDLSVRLLGRGKKRNRTWTFGVYNVYNRRNPFLYFYQEQSNGENILKQASLFTFLPNIAYQVSF